MTPLVPIAVIAAGISAASIYIDRRWQARKQAQSANGADSLNTDAPAGIMAGITSVWNRGPQRWVDRLTRQQPAELPQQFREWMSNIKVTEEEAPVQQWVQTLSDEGLQAFTKHLGTFCADMGFELTWLVQNQLVQNRALAQSAQQIVMNYCCACYQAATTQDDIEVYKQYQAFLQNPSSRQGRDFGQRLFAKVVESNLVSTSMADLKGTAEEQQQRLMEAINEASAKDHEAFMQAIKEVVHNTNGATPKASQSSTT